MYRLSKLNLEMKKYIGLKIFENVFLEYIYPYKAA